MLFTRVKVIYSAAMYCIFVVMVRLSGNQWRLQEVTLLARK